MTTPTPKVGDTVLTACKAPCGQPRVHTVIQSVLRGRIFMACTVCSSVTSVSKIEMEKQHA